MSVNYKLAVEAMNALSSLQFGAEDITPEFRHAIGQAKNLVRCYADLQLTNDIVSESEAA